MRELHSSVLVPAPSRVDLTVANAVTVFVDGSVIVVDRMFAPAVPGNVASWAVTDAAPVRKADGL
jgi:hypothetical protein